jgi:predicted kinase
MDKLCQAMLAGQFPPWPEILTSWQRALPLLAQLEATPQDPVWHGEGDVSVHTGLVLEEVRRGFLELPHLSPPEKLTLQLAAIFHDVGKPLTTKTREIHGTDRIISPRHAEAGRNYLCLRLAALGLPEEMEAAVLALVALHHHPRRLVQDDAPPARWRQLARQCPPALLYGLEMADLRGRLCPDLDAQLEIIELFRLRCEELGLWAGGDPWDAWRAAIESAFAGRTLEFQRHAIHQTIRDAEAGLIQSVEEGIARAWQLKDPAPQLILLWGPSGSGKSEWIAKNAAAAQVISLDAIRQEITGKREDQSMNGQVLQAAKERLKALLRRPGTVVWDATNLRQDLRAPLLQLGFDYGAHVVITVLKTPLPTLEARNRQRPHPVPASVLARQLEMLEWPEAGEAHDVRECRRS